MECLCPGFQECGVFALGNAALHENRWESHFLEGVCQRGERLAAWLALVACSVPSQTMATWKTSSPVWLVAGSTVMGPNTGWPPDSLARCSRQRTPAFSATPVLRATAVFFWAW